MSRKMFWGTTLPGCFVLVLVCAMLALPGSVLANPPDENGDHNHGGGGGGGDGGNIPVTVTFRDFLGDEVFSPDRVMSDFYDCPTTFDCLSPYVDDVDNVHAEIAQPGYLTFGLPSTKRNQPAVRTLFFDFSDCVESPCNPPFESGFSSYGANAFTSGVNLGEMFVGEVRHDLGLLMTLKPEGSGSRRLFFDPLDDRCSGSSYITVRRIDTDTWEIEAGPDDVACLANQTGTGKDKLVFSGLYHMPFKIIVQKM